ncbi:hypothetical protein EXS70_02010 [Candidatus Peribacteria bacterium]|nr:hypothetical protein [Candidatus Peribacteria bacterium]
MKRTSLFLLSLLLLSACGKEVEFPVPPGVQTVRAMLQAVPFSLKRRGTHALLASDGKVAAYAESTAVNLRMLEGRQVLLQGVYEKNIDPSAFPVLVVQKVLEGGEEEQRPWVMPARASSSSSRNAGASSQGPSSGRATGEGAPCGGSAGILCPSGFYCRITDPVGESGLCAKR